MSGFGARGKPEYLENQIDNQHTQSTYVSQRGQEIKPGPYWCKASALTTVTTLLSTLGLSAHSSD